MILTLRLIGGFIACAGLWSLTIGLITMNLGAAIGGILACLCGLLLISAT